LDAKCGDCGYEPARNAEGKLVDRHDCRYVQKVDALIPVAEDLARQDAADLFRAGKLVDADVSLTAFFHQNMNELCREQGLRRVGPFLRGSKTTN